MTALLLAAWNVARPILTFGVTLPAWLFLAGGLWLWVDRTSAVRTAVDGAVRELVAGAEIEALRARLDAERQIAAFLRGRAEALAAANAKFEAERSAAESENERLTDELDALKSQPVPGDCDVTSDFLERLR